MADAAEYSRLVSALTGMGMDPEAAAAAVATGIDPAKPPLPVVAGLSEDGDAARRTVAEIQNNDRTRNAGKRNRTDLPPLQGPGIDVSPLDMRIYNETQRSAYPETPFMRSEYTGDPIPDALPPIIGRSFKTAANPVGAAIDTITGIGGFGGFDGADAPAPAVEMTTGDPLAWSEDLLPPTFDRPAPAAPGAGTGSSGNPARAPNREVQAGLPSDEANVNPNPLNPFQQWTQDRFGWDEEKRGDIARAMMEGGLATMAGDSPYALQNIGAGGLAGMDAYYGAKDERYERARQEEIDRMARERHQRSMANDSEGQVFEDLERAKSLIAMGLDPSDFGIDISRLGIDDALVEEWGQEKMDDVQRLRAIRIALEADGIPPEQSLDAALAIMGKRAPEAAGIGDL